MRLGPAVAAAAAAMEEAPLEAGPDLSSTIVYSSGKIWRWGEVDVRERAYFGSFTLVNCEIFPRQKLYIFGMNEFQINSPLNSNVKGCTTAVACWWK